MRIWRLGINLGKESQWKGGMPTKEWQWGRVFFRNVIPVPVHSKIDIQIRK
jgi:hypothetical protein